ncbi:hypothetical protein JNM87_02320 [Candidatus Saccharibacteria bacterium]|nr:hypothetical protein [Candidatus Saccharibacteria bacterium]
MQTLANLLDKPMDRGEFLKHVSAGAALLMGGNIIARTLLGVQKPHTTSSASGYGASAYGGVKR